MLSTSADSGSSGAPFGFGCVRTGKNCGVPTCGSISCASDVCVPNAWNNDGARNDVPADARNEKFSVGRHSSEIFGIGGVDAVAVVLVARRDLHVQVFRDGQRQLDERRLDAAIVAEVRVADQEHEVVPVRIRVVVVRELLAPVLRASREADRHAAQRAEIARHITLDDVEIAARVEALSADQERDELGRVRVPVPVSAAAERVVVGARRDAGVPVAGLHWKPPRPRSAGLKRSFSTSFACT